MPEIVKPKTLVSAAVGILAHTYDGEVGVAGGIKKKTKTDSFCNKASVDWDTGTRSVLEVYKRNLLCANTLLY